MIHKLENTNIGQMCTSCVDKRKKETREKIASYKMEDFVGMYIKKAFSKNGKVEHMWVHITSVKSNTLCGIIDNDSVLVDETKDDEVVFYKEDIEEVLTSEGCRI